MKTYKELYNIAYDILLHCGTKKDYLKATRKMICVKKMKKDAFSWAAYDYYSSLKEA